MEKKRKSLTIQGSLYFTFVVPAIILIFILAGALALSSIYIRTQNSVILIIIINNLAYFLFKKSKKLFNIFTIT